MTVNKIEHLDFDKIYKVLRSSSISELDKTTFISNNRYEIRQIMSCVLDNENFQYLMQNRVLKKFRPLKNSYTKWGDKIILGKALNIPASQVPKYVKNVFHMLNDAKKLQACSLSTFDMIKTYVYRHGNQEELLAFFDYELKNSNDIQKCIKQNLSYNKNGVADYFVRPIHRMKYKTFVNLFEIVENNLNLACEQGKISKLDCVNLSKQSLVQLYVIRTNSQFINICSRFKVK